MGVADEDALGVDGSGGGVVVGLSVDEITSLQVIDGHGDSERLVFDDRGVAIGGEHKLGRRHGLCGENTAHDSWVARSRCDLLTIGERNA